MQVSLTSLCALESELTIEPVPSIEGDMDTSGDEGSDSEESEEE